MQDSALLLRDAQDHESADDDTGDPRVDVLEELGFVSKVQVKVKGKPNYAILLYKPMVVCSKSAWVQPVAVWAGKAMAAGCGVPVGL